MSLQFTFQDLGSLSDEQKAAILDCLVATTLADGGTDATEVARFESEAAKIPWGKDLTWLRTTVGESRTKVMAVKDKAAAQAFVRSCAEKLPGQPLREKILAAMAQIALADKSVNKSEVSLLDAYSQTFGVSPARCQEIVKLVISGG
jgi:uncharacterized tellurite resistance protein B-like protein